MSRELEMIVDLILDGMSYEQAVSAVEARLREAV